jgi:hypothetical protein
MNFFGIKASIDEFRYSYGAGGKAKAAAKVLGIATANTAIFACKALPKIVEKQKEEIQKLKNKG